MRWGGLALLPLARGSQRQLQCHLHPLLGLLLVALLGLWCLFLGLLLVLMKARNLSQRKGLAASTAMTGLCCSLARLRRG